MHCRPSRLLGIRNKLAAYCLDGAVVTLGTVIENALLERVESGEGATFTSAPKYTLEQLLDPAFTLPRPPSKRMQRQQVGAQLRAMLGKGAKAWK